MKIFIAGLQTESNTFSPIPTSLSGFRDTYLVRDGNHGDPPGYFGMPNVVFRRMAVERGWEVAESLCAAAQPAGPTVRTAYESLRDEILADLRRAMPVDIVLLNLHGAMVADGYDDCEGDILAAVRAIVGPRVPVGAELDLHCHVSERMVASATALVLFKEYPHIDPALRAAELFTLMADTAAGRIRPHTAVFDCRMMGIFATSPQPMRGFVDRMSALEGRDGVLSISLAHGFPWGDVPDAGTKILVITDDRPEKGRALAEQLGREFFALRDRVIQIHAGLHEAIDRALARDRGPVVIADTSDNPGGGAPGDSTTLLRALIERGVASAAFGWLWDPVAVRIAFDAGEGAELDMRLGGKMGPMSDDPIDLRVRVARLERNLTQLFGGTLDSLGDAARVSCNGVDIVLSSLRTQVFGIEPFVRLGVDPTRRRILVVKSTQHFYAAYAPIAREVFYVAAPGTTGPGYERVPFRRIKRPKWPLDPDPFAE